MNPPLYNCFQCLLLYFGMVFTAFPCFAQHILHGIIKDSATGKPVPSASVFISRTQLGGMSREDGSFALRLPGTDCDLVVSYVGFATRVLHLPASRRDSDVTVWLVAKSETLDNVTVTAKPVDRSDWLRYHAIFVKAFLGESDFAAGCTIENANVLHYQYNAESNTLTAYADKPVIVINKSLGYSIHYSLEDFSYDMNRQEIVFDGYPLFTPLTGNMRQMLKWKANRAETYNGSLLQFMRAVFRNRLAEDEFDVEELVKVAQQVPDKNGHRKKRSKQVPGVASLSVGRPVDNSFMVASEQPLTADSFAYAADSVTAAIAFAGTYMVTYKKGKTDAWYTTGGNSITTRQRIVSFMHLRDSKEPVFVESNGLFFPPQQLIIEGYWAWSERMARLLPYDYSP